MNSFVAGLLVEEVTGRPFVHELDRRILRPLSLRRTALSEDPTIAWAHTVYALRPDALATPGQQRARVESVVEAALTTTGPLAGR
ncbi:serine hydrolase [Streptomyces sp. NPDC058357]|uniref:serine hydrolase n=1 Tax=unclassified Streptomyces TaxID=2593676 RepID=UPI003651A2E0